MDMFVIGNGESRSGIDLEPLKKFGFTFGCNALYRDFNPHYLVAVDCSMIAEIRASGWGTRNGLSLITPETSLKRGWSSGPTALFEAACMARALRLPGVVDRIFLLGFDFYGKEGKINNLYKGTQNYAASGSQETFFGNWVNQIQEVLQDYPDIEFYRVGEGTGPELKGLSYITYPQMFVMLPVF